MRLKPALVADLVEQYGSPLYVYDAGVIARQIHAVNAGLSYEPRRILYSLKANPAVRVAALMRDHGLGLDACSPGDLRIAGLAGFAAGDVSWTGFGATDDELREAALLASDVVLDDAGELERFAALGVRREVGLRVNPGIAAGFHAHVRAGTPRGKFGIAKEAVPAALTRARECALRVVGLHAHLGSDVLAGTPHCELLELLADLAELVPHLRWCNVGGGFGTPRAPGDRAFDWSPLDAVAHARLGPRGIQLRVEPGSYLTMDAGLLVTRVRAVKAESIDRPRTVIVDATTNDLVSVLLYDATHPVTVVGQGAGPVTTCRVVGTLMQSGDVLAADVALPELVAGDLLAFDHAGAYAASRATTFNERPRAAEVLLQDGVGVQIRRRETVEDLLLRDL